MILPLPSWALAIPHVHDKLFIAWMYHIAEEHGFSYQYTLFPHDVRMICQRFYRDPAASWGQWARWVHFGRYDQTNWVFRWVNTPKKVVDYEFTDERSHLIWGYLMGREAEENIVTEFNGYSKGRSSSILGHRKLKQFQYYKDHSEEDDE